VGYQWFQSAMWYKTRNGDETETHYPTGMYLDRFDATTTPGLLVLHSPGNVFVRDLADGQTICVHPGAFLWKDETVQMALHVERPGGGFWSSNWQPATPFARFVGPGRVAVSSAYERSEGTGRITSTSPATSTDWGRQGFSVAAAAMGQPVDDSRVRAGVGAFLTASGFSEADHDLKGPAATTTYSHPSGMKVAVTVMSAASLVNVAQSVAGMLGGARSLNGSPSAREVTASLGNITGSRRFARRWLRCSGAVERAAGLSPPRPLAEPAADSRGRRGQPEYGRPVGVGGQHRAGGAGRRLTLLRARVGDECFHELMVELGELRERRGQRVDAIRALGQRGLRTRQLDAGDDPVETHATFGFARQPISAGGERLEVIGVASGAVDRRAGHR
jgi:hypothetical protein